MNLRANPESKFLLKYLLAGLACLGFAALSVYDGFFKYPAQLNRAYEWESLEREFEEAGNTQRSGWKERWDRISEENQWSHEYLSEKETVAVISQNIWFQYLFILIATPIGILSLVKYFRTKSSYLETTEDSIRSSLGGEVKISQIEKFDKKKWDKKGIGILSYRTENGAKKKFTIDDLKYQREPTDAMVRWIESQIPAEMIVGGEPEPIPETDTIEQVGVDSP